MAQSYYRPFPHRPFRHGTFVRVRVDTSISDTLVRFGMNGVMVCHGSHDPGRMRLNFGLPLGIIAGLLGAVTSIEIGITGLMGVLTAMAIAAPIAVVLGCSGQLLNRVKGAK